MKKRYARILTATHLPKHAAQVLVKDVDKEQFIQKYS